MIMAITIKLQDLILLMTPWVLLVLLIIVVYLLFKPLLYKLLNISQGASKTVSVEVYNEVVSRLKKAHLQVEKLNKESQLKQKEFEALRLKYLQNNEEYKKDIEEINNLKEINNNLEQKLRDLARENNELKKLVGKEPAPPIIVGTTTTDNTIPSIPKSVQKEGPEDNTTTNTSQQPVQNVTSNEVPQETEVQKDETKDKEEVQNEVPQEEVRIEPIKEKTMYASFPRSAGSSIYFSDLSEKQLEDSYFEFKITIESGKATFKPIDFMKIRNYDPAMAAMRTEGVKPNVASIVQGIEHGKAHKEGKDWIIDNPAKIKLA